MTFQRREDKDKFLREKKNLLVGVYANKEFPLHIKRVRDQLRPVLCYIKTNPKYKDKCKLQGDKLVMDGVKYSMDNIIDLPQDIAAYKTTEKCKDLHIIFYEELSLYSNFHLAKFTIDGVEFPLAEHYIQYQKSLFCRDSVTANQILKSETVLESKKLSHRIEKFSRHQWESEAYELCEIELEQNLIRIGYYWICLKQHNQRH